MPLRPRQSKLLRRRLAIRAFLVAAASLIALTTLTPTSDAPIPGRLCLICGEVGGVDAILNVILFLPLGAGLALTRRGRLRAFAVITCSTVTIEALQLFVIVGRDACLGDILANALGGSLGYEVGAHIRSLLLPKVGLANRLVVLWLCFWLAIQYGVAYALAPRPTNRQYYGQIARPLGDELPFRGQVVGASLAGIEIPDWEVRPWQALRDSLAKTTGASLDIRLISASQGPGLAPIARVLDELHEEEIFVAAQRGDLLFRTRTAASDLRLRPLTYRWRAVLSPHREGDSLQLSLRYNLPRAELRIGGLFSEQPISTGSGWRLISPRWEYVDGSREDQALDALWQALLLFPLGYWLFHASKQVKNAASHLLVVMLTSFGAVYFGLVILPPILGMTPARVTELGGAILGLSTGVITSKLFSRHGSKIFSFQL